MTLTRGISLPRQRGANFADSAVETAFHLLGQAGQHGDFFLKFRNPGQQLFALSLQFRHPLGQLGGAIQALAHRSGGVFEAFQGGPEAFGGQLQPAHACLILKDPNSLGPHATILQTPGMDNGVGRISHLRQWGGKSGQPLRVTGMPTALDGGAAPSLRPRTTHVGNTK